MDQSKLTIGTFDADALLAMADLVKPTLLRHTVQLFTREHKPEPEASGVVVRYRGEVFLFTAAHALAAFKERPLWLMVRDVLVKMEGPLFMGFTGTPDLGDHFGDPMDAAVVLLPEKIATDLDAFALDDGQVPKAPDMAYYLTAFPAHRTEVDTQDEEIWVTPIARVFAEADETVYAEEKCDRRTHIVFRRHSHDPLDGASGGPIWALTLRGTSEPPDVRLVASFIEANTDVGVAARIQLHMELASRNISDRRGE